MVWLIVTTASFSICDLTQKKNKIYNLLLFELIKYQIICYLP